MFTGRSFLCLWVVVWVDMSVGAVGYAPAVSPGL